MVHDDRVREPRGAILYARVSTEEQAKNGYSLAQQLEALREYAARAGYEVIEEVADPGESGATLERPGVDRVRELVASGGVSVVLAQDLDRISREPWHYEYLRSLLEDYGTELRALDDGADGSPMGEFVGYIRRGIAKLEKAEIVKRSRRGKLEKAREGKIVASNKINYGFRYTEDREGYEVDEEKMAVVRRIFRMVAVEGASVHGVKRLLELEDVPNPSGGRYWDKKAIKRLIQNDVYRPHAHEEIFALVRPKVAAGLDPSGSYGVKWFNRRSTRRTRARRPDGDGGHEYYWRQHVSENPPDEWVAVPVPDSGIPRERVDAARAAVADGRPTSRADGRFWELSGALMRCAGCGRAMETVTRTARKRSGGRYVFCYYRCREGNRKRETCANNRSLRSDMAHPAVWGLVSDLLSDPERVRRGLERMLEEERGGPREDPEHEKGRWLEKIAACERRRAGYLDLAADGLMGRDELRAKLSELEEDRGAARRELDAIEGRQERLRGLERGKDALLASYAAMVPEALDGLTPEERHRVYKMLRLSVLACSDRSLEVSGVLCTDPGLGTSGPAST